MRLSNPLNIRPLFYDRNPINRQTSYSGSGVAPHAWTVRFQFTVPTGKKLWLEYGMMESIRRTAATTAGEITQAIYVTPYGGSPANFMVRRYTSNTVNDQQYRDATTQALLLAGDVIAGGTADASTGGTVDYTMTIHAIEFDA